MAYTRNRNRAPVILRSLILTLSILSSIPGYAQSSGSQTNQLPQAQSVTEPDLINPDRPGIADGSTVVGSKTLQIETGIQLEFRRSADNREHTLFFPTLIRFGFGSHWEARIEGNTFTRVTTFDSANVS